MHIRSILAIARKDALDILLNKQMLAVLLTPIFMAVLFTTIVFLIGNNTKTSNILIYDPNPIHSNVDQIASIMFDHPMVSYTHSAAEVQHAFGPAGTHKSSTYSLGLIVPADFDNDLRLGNHPQIGLYSNGDNVNPQNIIVIKRMLTDYTNSIAHPEPAATISLVTINPPATNNAFDTSTINDLYTTIIVVVSLMTSAYIVPSLIIEEKEKKTIRMLMVSPVSFTDIILGKLLVGLVYQIIMSLITLVLIRGYTGNIPIVLLCILIGTCFVLSMGLLAGCLFQTSQASGTFMGTFGTFFFILPGMFVGPIGEIFMSNPAGQLIKILPTYYLAETVYNALKNQTTPGNTLLNIGIVLASTLILFLLAVWSLRRQAAVAAAL